MPAKPHRAAATESLVIIEILRHTPLWVWCLLSALVALGLTQRRQRELTPLRILITPLALGALGVSMLWPALRALPLSVALWLLCLTLSFAASARWLVPLGTRWNAATRRLHVPGSGWPLVLILATFLLKYTIGVFQAMQPAAAATPAFLVALAMLSGAISGLWLGRTWAMLRLTDFGRAAAPLHAQPSP
jgi:hypothetical protein